MILEIFSPEALISFMDWTLSSRLWLVSSTRCAASVISPDTLRVFSAWRRVIAAVSVAEDEVSSSVAGGFQDIAGSWRRRHRWLQGKRGFRFRLRTWGSRFAPRW